MRTNLSLLAAISMTVFTCFSCGNDTTTNTPAENNRAGDTVTKAPSIKEESVTYTADGTEMKGFVAFDENAGSPRPVVLVVPEWWGLNDYPRSRAKQLAEMGYTAMVVDMFGGGKTAANPQEAMAFTKPFYSNPALSKSRLEAALAKVKEYRQADSSNVAAIGYCFGGNVVLNAARLGANLKGVVSFHGNLAGAPANKDLLKARVLVAHGASDNFVPPAEIAAFKKSMDSIGANYQFKVYENATHAFTNPDATATGKKFDMPIAYNGAADTASWNDMKAFFAQIFPR